MAKQRYGEAIEVSAQMRQWASDEFGTWDLAKPRIVEYALGRLDRMVAEYSVGRRKFPEHDYRPFGSRRGEPGVGFKTDDHERLRDFSHKIGMKSPGHLLDVMLQGLAARRAVPPPSKSPAMMVPIDEATKRMAVFIAGDEQRVAATVRDLVVDRFLRESVQITT